MWLLNRDIENQSLKIFCFQVLIQGLIFAIILSASGENNLYAQFRVDQYKEEKIKDEVIRLMDKGDIPGVSVVVLAEGQSYIGSFGYENLENRRPVTSRTLFEIGSCTKAFTAMALLRLEEEGMIDMDVSISNYLPWFYAVYKDSVVTITLRQLMHHTSGIPWRTLSQIPEGNHATSLKNTVERIVGLELNNWPGAKFEYASINYDIIGLIIEEVTQCSFEVYVNDKILTPLKMFQTSVGYLDSKQNMASGYKIGFFRPREYQAPVYRGNNPAGYLITNAPDLLRWLSFQLGVIKTGTVLDTLVTRSHYRDVSVSPDRASLSSYAAGWEVFLTGEGKIAHSGLNPTFSSYIGFIPDKNLAIAVMGNSNSSYTGVIGDHLFKILLDQEVPADPETGGYDRNFSIIVYGLCLYIISILFYVIFKLYSIYKNTSIYARFTKRSLLNLLITSIFLGILLWGVYLIPQALVGFSWDVAIVWAPSSFMTMVYTLSVALIVSYFVSFINILFPNSNKYINAAPELIILSLASGIANASVIVLITSSVSQMYSNGDHKNLYFTLFYFLAAFLIYVYSRRVVQTKLIRLGIDLVYDYRVKLLGRIFSSSFEEFERINKGKVYATLSNDTDKVGNSAGAIVNLSTNLITLVAVFGYLILISFKASIATILAIVAISSIYYFVSKASNIPFRVVRDILARYLELLNGMIDGFKELSLHLFTRLSYKRDVEEVNNEIRKKLTSVRIGFVNAYLAGESLLIFTLALLVFAFPIFFPALRPETILTYIVVMLYLIAPINAILAAIPELIQIKVSWDRIQSFQQELPGNFFVPKDCSNVEGRDLTVSHFSVKGLRYKYCNTGVNRSCFEIGPIEFELRQGESLFIIGENGSGKTTLIKLLTGLYHYKHGRIEINGERIESAKLGEYFSVVFNPFHLFRRIYGFEGKVGAGEINTYLERLELSEKVEIINGCYSTIDLSQGQRKRLALMQIFLEDRPIYLFDEWGADQDPGFRRFFYKVLIPEMKSRGKLIIAVSHDDRYFEEADSIIKLNRGRLEVFKAQSV